MAEWHTKPYKPIQRTPKTDAFFHKTGFCCIEFFRVAHVKKLFFTNKKHNEAPSNK